jgi:hypothetical protein
MKSLISLILLIGCFSAQAAFLKSKVHSIDKSTSKDVPHLIKLENGNVVFVKYEDTQVLRGFEEDLSRRKLLEIEVDERHEFQQSREIDNETFIDEEEDDTKPNPSYDPSEISYYQAKSSFRRMRRDYQNDSQCYNRAHIWAYEEYNKTKLKSSKLFLFFTNRYIRNYRYKWWFHVAPMVESPEGSLVLDRRFTSGPRSIKSWTNNFIHSRRTCPIVDKYKDYSNNQQSQDCYLIPVSMYFWQPRDIEKRDDTGYAKSSFISSEVDYAYWEAF